MTAIIKQSLTARVGNMRVSATQKRKKSPAQREPDGAVINGCYRRKQAWSDIPALRAAHICKEHAGLEVVSNGRQRIAGRLHHFAAIGLFWIRASILHAAICSLGVELQTKRGYEHPH